MAIPKASFDVPYKTQIIGQSGLLTQAWEWFFRSLWERLYPLGAERSFEINNNQSSPADITGMKFDKRGISAAVVEYLIQRVTTSTGATELVEAGIFIVAYKPFAAPGWNLTMVHGDKPLDSGVTFSITDAGQVQYTSTSITGTASISRIVWRARTLTGKHSSYSNVGPR